MTSAANQPGDLGDHIHSVLLTILQVVATESARRLEDASEDQVLHVPEVLVPQRRLPTATFLATFKRALAFLGEILM